MYPESSHGGSATLSPRVLFQLAVFDQFTVLRNSQRTLCTVDGGVPVSVAVQLLSFSALTSNIHQHGVARLCPALANPDYPVHLIWPRKPREDIPEDGRIELCPVEDDVISAFTVKYDQLLTQST